MRLINATTLSLEVFNDASRRPPYAILSHRWVDDHEVTFEDMQRPHRQWMPAWSKINLCCQQARVDGLNYVWVDTCCIDKSSSAELSEAINSMYMWYFNSDRCYAYLNDVLDTLHDHDGAYSSYLPIKPQKTTEDIIDSKWFTRAWTLQELIAPKEVVFYDAQFRRLGSKVDFAERIEQSVMIPAELLTNPQRLPKYPVAVRMSWATNRQASRTEDIAYSLFGLFGVNLPLLYGEGTRAFLRLQEEIIRQTYDHSIFVWSCRTKGKWKRSNEQTSGQLPLLASSPGDFEDCRDIAMLTDSDDVRPYAMTNLGLQIELKIFPYDLNVYVGLLDCESISTASKYGILLARQSEKASRWHRVCVKGIDRVTIKHPEKLKRFVWQKMHIVKYPSAAYDRNECEDLSDACHPHTAFYGLNIHAPAFLAYSTEASRPYALVAYYDWEAIPEATVIREDSEYFQPGYTANIDARLSPSSHIGLALSIDQTLTLAGFRRSKSHGLYEPPTSESVAEGHRKQPAANPHHSDSLTDTTRTPSSAITLGVLAMPLMTTGTAGVIFFDHPVYGIRSIKAGFDFEFRPVIFLATHEAEVDPQFQIWMQQRRYAHPKSFERYCNLLDSFGDDDNRQFLTLNLDCLRNQKDVAFCADGSVLIDKGVYAFTCRATAGPNHWIFKPYENQHWHIALGLDKRERDGLAYWEFTMDKREDLVKLEIQLL